MKVAVLIYKERRISSKNHSLQKFSVSHKRLFFSIIILQYTNFFSFSFKMSRVTYVRLISEKVEYIPQGGKLFRKVEILEEIMEVPVRDFIDLTTDDASSTPDSSTSDRPSLNTPARSTPSPYRYTSPDPLDSIRLFYATPNQRSPN